MLQRAYAGNVVEKRVAGAAIREFEGILDELYSRPPKWEMVTMHRDEVENMREIIKYQDKKLREVTERVNSMSHGDIPKYPLPTVEDHSDMKARMDLTTKFNAIYDREWRMAYSELYDSLRWKDAECIYSLMRVVRNASDLCYNLATDQLESLLVNMENTVVNPLNGSNTRFKQLYQGPNIKYTEGMTVAEKYALEYRRKRAEASVPAVVELFMETKLRMIIDPADLKREMKKYIEKVVEVIWLMTAQNPAMRIYWQQQTERVLTEFFDYYDRKGDFVNQTVWPAVFVHSTGKLLSKGYILAM